MSRHLPLAVPLLLACHTAMADPCAWVSSADFARALGAPVVRSWAVPEEFDDEYDAPIAECIANSDDARAATVSAARYASADAARAGLDRLTALAKTRAATEPAAVTRENDSTLIVATREPVMIGVTLHVDRWLIGSTTMLTRSQSTPAVTQTLKDLARTAARAVEREAVAQE